MQGLTFSDVPWTILNKVGHGWVTRSKGPTWSTRLGAEQDQLSRVSTGTSSANSQETKTCMVRACHMPQQPLKNQPSGYLGGWVTQWLWEEMLDGQHQRMDITTMPKLLTGASCRKD